MKMEEIMKFFEKYCWPFGFVFVVLVSAVCYFVAMKSGDEMTINAALYASCLPFGWVYAWWEEQKFLHRRVISQGP
jgi:hypothetical protein